MLHRKDVGFETLPPGGLHVPVALEHQVNNLVPIFYTFSKKYYSFLNMEQHFKIVKNK